MSSRFKPYLALVTVQLLFGIWPIFGKIVMRSMSSTSLVVLRITGAAIALSILQRRLTPLLKMRTKDILLLTLCSILGVVGNQLLFVKGLSLTTVINATLLSTIIPVYALAVSVLLGYERGSLKTLFGIVVSAAGVIYLVNPAQADLRGETTAGNLVILASTFIYAIYIVISKDLFERYGALNVITWIFLVGAVMTVPIGIYSMQMENLAAVSARVWLLVGGIILLPTVAAYYLNAWALTRVAPSTVAIFIYLQPLIAFGLAPLFLGESWNWRTVLAAVFIFAGVALVTTDSARQTHVSLT